MGKFMERWKYFVRENHTYIHNQRRESFRVFEYDEGYIDVALYLLSILVQTHSANQGSMSDNTLFECWFDSWS